MAINIGDKFNMLTVIELCPHEKGKPNKCICKCDCGNITKPIYINNLTRGNTKSCGCLKIIHPNARKDLTGKKFGRLTVLGDPYTGERGTYWKCQCECGNIVYKPSADLVSGKVNSCGCLKRDLHSTMNDLTGQRFGKLTALFSNEVAKDGQRIWVCQCDCGNTIEALAGNLRKGNTTSCGCLTSRGNYTIRKLLIEKNIPFAQEYCLEDCKDIKQLRFDFALFKNNSLTALIEYQGEQHYKNVDFFGGNEEFQNRQRRDRIKYDYCLDKNIKLYYITYEEKIEERLEEILSELYGE